MLWRISRWPCHEKPVLFRHPGWWVGPWWRSRLKACEHLQVCRAVAKAKDGRRFDTCILAESRVAICYGQAMGTIWAPCYSITCSCHRRHHHHHHHHHRHRLSCLAASKWSTSRRYHVISATDVVAHVGSRCLGCRGCATGTGHSRTCVHRFSKDAHQSLSGAFLKWWIPKTMGFNTKIV